MLLLCILAACIMTLMLDYYKPYPWMPRFARFAYMRVSIGYERSWDNLDREVLSKGRDLSLSNVCEVTQSNVEVFKSLPYGVVLECVKSTRGLKEIWLIYRFENKSVNSLRDSALFILIISYPELSKEEIISNVEKFRGILVKVNDEPIVIRLLNYVKTAVTSPYGIKVWEGVIKVKGPKIVIFWKNNLMYEVVSLNLDIHELIMVAMELIKSN